MMESDDENQNAPIIHSHTIAARCKAVLPHTHTYRPRISPPLGSRLRFRDPPFTRRSPCLAFAIQMTITDAHADFLSDTYAGMNAALDSSASSLREYWEHSFQARDGLTGSILKLKDGSWAIIPPDDRSVKGSL